MNITGIIEKKRAALEAFRNQTEKERATNDLARSVLKECVRDVLRTFAQPILEDARAQLESSGLDAHVTFSEEVRGGETLDAWVVATVSLVIDRRRPIVFNLQFIGITTLSNWHILADSSIKNEDRSTKHRFTGSPEELESFVVSHIEDFVSSACEHPLFQLKFQIP